MHDFLTKCLNSLHPILKRHWEIDHVCYRTKSIDHYEETKAVFAYKGELVTESLVGGRPIATYKLHRPKVVSDYVVDLVEVPAPKAGRQIDEGYEHLEVVIDCPFSELMESYPHINWNTRALSKVFNPELEAHFDNFNVKFHHHSLEQIINIEKDTRVSSFLDETNFLKRFASFHPMVSGTIPLAIHTQTSDLDILLMTNDLDLLADHIKNHFEHAHIKIKEEYLVANFQHHNLSVELYGEKNSPLRQNAHRHLRVEARLMKVLGNQFILDIHKLKQAGVKTEPAFGELLGLSSPYDDLLELSLLSDLEMMQRFGALYAMKPV